MVCVIVVWGSLVGFGGDLMCIHRIYLIIPDLVLLMRARHRMKELLRGSGIWSKFLQTYSKHVYVFLYVVCCTKALLGVICFKFIMVFINSLLAVFFLFPSTSTRLSTALLPARSFLVALTFCAVPSATSLSPILSWLFLVATGDC
jgi:hypothetical protein